VVEAPGSNPGPKLLTSGLYVRIWQFVSPRIADYQRPLPELLTCLIFVRPVTRRSAIRLIRLPRALAAHRSDALQLLFRQRERLRYRSQLFSHQDLRGLQIHARSYESLSPSKRSATRRWGNRHLAGRDSQRPVKVTPRKTSPTTPKRLLRRNATP